MALACLLQQHNCVGRLVWGVWLIGSLGRPGLECEWFPVGEDEGPDVSLLVGWLKGGVDGRIGGCIWDGGEKGEYSVYGVGRSADGWEWTLERVGGVLGWGLVAAEESSVPGGDSARV